MSDEEKPGPVDNSHRDAGIAARESQKEPTKTEEAPKPEAKQEAKPEAKVVETVEEVPEGEETQNETGESADPGSDEHAKPKNRGVGKRIDELTKARYDAERERDYWREQAMRQQPKPEAQPAQAAERESDEPTLESCDFDVAEFNRKWYAWRRGEDQRVEAEQAAQSAHQARLQTLAQKEAAFRAEHPDYDAVAKDPTLPITQAMAEVLFDCDDPPAIAYYLGQNPQEAAAIAQMTPHQIGRAIGRIEAKLSAPPAATETQRQPEPKTVTKAPPPVTTLSGAPAIQKAVDDMSMAEYDAHRRAERAAKGLPP